MVDFLGDLSVLELTNIPDLLSDQEAEDILHTHWEHIEPKCTALVIQAFTVTGDLGTCQCACGDASIRNAGVRFDYQCNCDMNNPGGGCPDAVPTLDICARINRMPHDSSR